MTTKWLKLIGWMQLAGGVLGATFIAIFIVQVVEVPFAPPSGYFIIAPALFCLSAIAGVLILRRHPLALKLSIVVQSLQIIQIISKTITFKFIAGINVVFFISSSHVRLSPGFTGDYWIGSYPFNEPSGIAINFIAASILLYLIRIHRKLSGATIETPNQLSKSEEFENNI